MLHDPRWLWGELIQPHTERSSRPDPKPPLWRLVFLEVLVYTSTPSDWIKSTRHTASTSMYSLTFCVRVILPERHHWKPTVQAVAVMLRTPPVDGQSPASEPRPLAIYGAQCWERFRHPPVTNQQRARYKFSYYYYYYYYYYPRKLGFALCCHSNATRVPIANLPNSAQLGGSLYQAPKLHPGPCSNVGVQPWTDTQMRVTSIHFASSMTHTKCNNCCEASLWNSASNSNTTV